MIDDHAFIQKMLVSLLFKLGFETVHVAENGQEGLDQCRLNNPSLILCDIEMEPVDGLEFRKKLRKAKEIKCWNAPVIFLTSHGEAAIVGKAIKYGACGYLLKPVSMVQLKKHVKQALGF